MTDAATLRLSADERNLLLSETPGWLRCAAIEQHQKLTGVSWEHGCREHAACRTYLAYCEWMKLITAQSAQLDEIDRLRAALRDVLALAQNPESAENFGALARAQALLEGK